MSHHGTLLHLVITDLYQCKVKDTNGCFEMVSVMDALNIYHFVDHPSAYTAYTVYYKYHFSGKIFYNFASISPFESFKANDDNNTLNCPHPPFPYKKIMDLKTNIKLIRNWYIYILKLKFWVSSMI